MNSVAEVEFSHFEGLSPEQQGRLSVLLDDYFASLEQGHPLNREQLVARYPDLAGPLAAYLESIEFLQDAAVGFCAAGEPVELAEAGEFAQRQLGDFSIVREIGRGGMGVVYEAQQISLDRRVALKVLPFAALLDTKQIARFKSEAQAAAQVCHPHIVPVFAVGSDRGVHYYAMQYIDGQPLDRAISELRRHQDTDDQEAGSIVLSGSTREAFATDCSTDSPAYFRTATRLGIQAAEALHAAHEYGVVHRDVKPSNLLLDAQGSVWITDFGLARMRTDASLTRSGEVVGTVRYMSPEQALGESALVDHRTDIYSLGITLYELITLQHPLGEADVPECLRRLDREEPAPLRSRNPRVPLDLENVILKAISRSREDRYSTASDLADDLRRFLQGKPTLARPPTVLDRASKWARRHMVAATASVFILFIAVVALAVSTLLIAQQKRKTELALHQAEQNFERAEANLQRAEANYRQTRQAVDEFGALVAERLAHVPGAEQVRREALERTLAYYRGFAEQSRYEPNLRSDLALTYSKIGKTCNQIGEVEEAITAHEQALRIYQQLASDSTAVEVRSRLALCHNNFGLLLCEMGQTERAERAYRAAIRLLQQLTTYHPRDVQHQRDLALSYSNLGLLQNRMGKRDEAERSFIEAVGLQREVSRQEPKDSKTLGDLAASLNHLSCLYQETDAEHALPYCQEALDIQQKLVDADLHGWNGRHDAALTYNNLGSLDLRCGRLDQAVDCYRKSIDILSRFAEFAPKRRGIRRDLAVGYNNLGMALDRLDESEEAKQSFLRALTIQQGLSHECPDDLNVHSSLGGIYNNIGMIFVRQGKPELAASVLASAAEHQRIAFNASPEVVRYREFLSKHYYNYGRVLRMLNRSSEAAEAALARKQLWSEDPGRLYSIAEELALACESLAAQRGSTARDSSEWSRYASEAVSLLAAAIEAGRMSRDEINGNRAFASLRHCAAFGELLASMDVTGS